MKKAKEKPEDKIQILVEKRNIFGKKVKRLRKEGLLPANIFGQEVKSQSVQLPIKDFARVFRKAGESQIIFLKIKGKEEEFPALIQNVQTHPVTGEFLHVDFRFVNLKKKIKTEVPIKFVGESEAIKQNKGVLLTLTETLEIEALPAAIPKKIEIDISSLKELNDEIKVKDVKTNGEYLIIEPPEKVIVRITAHKEETTEPQVVAPETVEVTTEKKVEEPTEQKSIASPQSTPQKEEKK